MRWRRGMAWGGSRWLCQKKLGSGWGLGCCSRTHWEWVGLEKMWGSLGLGCQMNWGSLGTA